MDITSTRNDTPDMSTWNFEYELVADAVKGTVFVKYKFSYKVIDVQRQTPVIVDEEGRPVVWHVFDAVQFVA